MERKFNITKNKLGYYEASPKPSKSELSNYYNLKYYQNQSGNYRSEYTLEEFTFFKNKEIRKIHVLDKKFKLSKASLLDIGCGEGFSLKHFHDLGWNVLGVDFSSYGLNKNNPSMKKFFLEGDLVENMKELQVRGKTFDVISLNNLLEHVIDPENTIDLASKLLTNCGVLIIEVPNDFSNFQLFLKENKLINEEFWLAYPDHLNYFSRTSLNNLLSSKSMREVFSLADFPIDIFLSNPQSNYIIDKSKGKDAHMSRILIDNFFTNESIEKTISLYEAMANIGFGRQIVSFFKKTE